ncbi:hypothetical protein [Cohnella cholangitidis]|nr:hypothetical protein [Cohnella cholangitidis]
MRKAIKHSLGLLFATMLLAGCTSAPPAESPAASQAVQLSPEG